MIKSASFKPWTQSKAEIEYVLNNEADFVESDVYLVNGIQHKQTISHNSSPIFSVAYRMSKKSRLEFFVLNYISPESGEIFFVQWKYDALTGACKVTKKVHVRQCLKILIYIPSQHAYIGYCSDMTLRGYSGVSFEEKSRLSVHSSVLSMLYIEDHDELITAGQGYVFSWTVKIIEYGFLVDPKSPPFLTEVNSSREWVTRLFYDKVFKTIMALTDDTIYIISLVTRQQIKVFYNTHKSSLSYCTFYHPLQYFITAARDGTVHIYHTGIQSLTRTFSAHLDGLTGVSCLSKQPILITWSQKSGNMRMWRLDTLEMTNETTLSQSISKLYIPCDDRLFYLGDTEVQIFSIKILYTIFTNLSSSIDIMKLSNVRRIKKDADPESNLKNTSADGSAAPNARSSIDNGKVDNEKHEKASRGSKRWNKILNKLEIFANPTESYVKSLQDGDLCMDRSTVLDERLMCVLDDFSIIQVSPITGLSLNITSPSLEVDQRFLSADVHKMGSYCYVVMENGKLVNFDISSNPGQIASIYEPRKIEPKVSSVATAEVYVDEGEHTGLRAQAVFVGMENGTITLGNNAANSGSSHRRKSITYTDADKNSSSGISSSSAIDSQPDLMMTPIQAHNGKITMMCAPVDGSLTIDYENTYSAKIYNILLTLGNDSKIIVWRANVVAGPNPSKFEVGVMNYNPMFIEIVKLLFDSLYDRMKKHLLFQMSEQVLLNKLQYLKLKFPPTCLAVASNIILFGFDNGQVDMFIFNWKYLVSCSGAKIKIECNNILLNAFKTIQVGQEFYHKKIVTSAHASQMLGLFVTTSEDALIKIWDTDGMMVRELFLGEVVPSVCFALGRNLLATLKNYVILIEAVAYLPVEYLQKLLTYAEEHDLSDPEPEIPLGVTGTELALAIPAKLVEEEKPAANAAVGSKPASPAAQDDMKNVNNLLRFLRRKRSFYSQALEAVQNTESKVEMFSGIKLRDFVPIVKIKDLSENLYSDIERIRMKKYVVSPDGSIPNSMIRAFYKPITTIRILKKVENSESVHDDLFSFDRPRDAKARRFALRELDYVGSDEGSFELVERGSSLNRIQVLELSDRAKWEIKDEIMEKKIESKIRLKSKTRIRKSLISVQLKTNKTSKQVLDVEANAVEASPSSLRLNRLRMLLQELNKQRWCSHIITLETFEEGLAAIAVILQRAGSRICSEICKLIVPIMEATKELKEKDGHDDLFSFSLQQRFVTRLAELLFSPAIALQRAAASILSKFSDELLLNSLFTSVMPKFLETSAAGKKVLQSNELILAEVSRVVKYFADNIETDRLFHLAHMARIEEYRDGITDENSWIIDGAAEALNRAKVDPIDLHVWANFILPLISKRKVLGDPVPDAQVELKDSEKAAEHAGSKAGGKHRRRRSVTAKSKVVKTGSQHATKKTSQLEAIKKDRHRKRKVSFDVVQLAQTLPPHPPKADAHGEKETKKGAKHSAETEAVHVKDEVGIAVEIKVSLRGQASDEKIKTKKARKESVGSGDIISPVKSVLKHRESVDLSRTKSYEILRKSSCELKQFQDTWIVDDDVESREDREDELAVAGVPVSPSASEAELLIGASFDVVQFTRGKRPAMTSAQDIERNRSILILQSKRRLSLQTSPSAYRARSKTSEYFSGISKVTIRKSSVKDQGMGSRRDDKLMDSMMEKWKAREQENGFESFLPAIVEQSREFDTESSQKDLLGSSSGRSVSQQSDAGGASTGASSSLIIHMSTDDSKSYRPSSTIPSVCSDPFLPSPPPPTASLCDVPSRHAISSQNLKSSSFFDEFKPRPKSSLSEDLGLRDRRLKVELPSISFDSFTEINMKEEERPQETHPSPNTDENRLERGSVSRRSANAKSPPHPGQSPTHDVGRIPSLPRITKSPSHLDQSPPHDVSQQGPTLPRITTPVDAALDHKGATKKSLSKVRFSSESETDKSMREVPSAESEEWRDVLKILRQLRLRREERRQKQEQKRASSFRSTPRSMVDENQEFKGRGDFVQSHDQGRRSEISKQEYKRKVERLNTLTTQSRKNVTQLNGPVGGQLSGLVGGSHRKEAKIRRVLDRIIFAPNKALSDNMLLLRRKLNYFFNSNRKSGGKSPLVNENFMNETNLHHGPTSGLLVGQTEKVVYKWDHKGTVLSLSHLEALH